MSVEVTVPQVGESITEGILAEWVVTDGAAVAMDDPLFVLETDKVTMTINAEAAGRLSISVQAGETVEVGQTVATIDPDAAGEAPAPEPAAKKPEQKAAAPQPEPAKEAERTPAPPAPSAADERASRRREAPREGAAPTAGGPPITVPAGMPQVRSKLEHPDDLSPAVRRLVAEHDLDPARITGTGRGGRLTKEDVLHHLDERDGSPEAAPQTAPAAPRTAAPAAARGERQTRRAMTTLRQRVAERLVQVQQTAAILTTFNEADMSRVRALRARWRESFRDRHGTDLGFMSFFVKATVEALRTVPQVNAFIDGNEIVENNFYDIGVAVSTERGLVVPVVRDADRLSFADLEAEIGDLARRARERTLELSDLTGGVFTISNGGVFGSMMSTPILNPPQSAILGMHAIQKRPVVVDDEIVIRPMMYLALSYDHRLIDGREAVTFLKRIKECIEDPERLLLEV